MGVELTLFADTPHFLPLQRPLERTRMRRKRHPQSWHVGVYLKRHLLPQSGAPEPCIPGVVFARWDMQVSSNRLCEPASAFSNRHGIADAMHAGSVHERRSALRYPWRWSMETSLLRHDIQPVEIHAIGLS